MPGFCGIYRHGKPIIHDFCVQTGITITKEKEFSSENIYVRQYIIPKFENDKLFIDLDSLFYCTDGVIFNASELGEDYTTSNLSSLLPEMYKSDGLAHINKLRGVFSGVIIDKVRKELHLFTDHLGSKRLFYYYNPDTKDFFFASDLKIVTTLMEKYGYETILSEEGAYCLLTFGFMLGDTTLCSDIHHLEPGTVLTLSLDTGNIHKKRYYELKSTPYIEDTEKNIIKEIDKRFCKAIQREYNKDLEYGYQHAVTLSGGLDSRMTLVKGVMGGYKNIRTLTFSESGYLDEKIAEKIASDLGCDHVFHALDNGNYLLNVEEPVKGNDGLILYSGAAHQLSSVAMLNWEKLGLLHTGMIGDLILGSYLQEDKHHSVDSGMIKRMAYSSKLLDRLNDEISMISTKHNTDEICAFYERCINGVYNGYFMTQNYTEYASPFLDVDFVDYVMKVHPKLRYKNKLYAKWITKTTPIAEKYIWESTMSKINTPYFIGFCKRAFHYLKGRILKQRLVSMNPFNYWYAHNPAIKEYFDEKYAEGINGLSGYENLLSDTKKMYSEGTPLEKTQVLTLLEAVKWLHLS